jgi:two-component system LytT family response regulator
MNVLIVEDENLSAKRLIKMLTGKYPQVRICAVTDSVSETVKYLSSNQPPDLAFFDIELADGQSFEIFNRIAVPCPVIFATAYDEFALRAFKVNSIDYLLKPIDESELIHAVEKFKQIKSLAPSDSIMAMIKQLNQKELPEYKDRFLVKSGQKLVMITEKQIAYFYAEDKTTLLKTFKNQTFTINHTLDELSDILNQKMFFRVNRQFIIHAEAVSEIHLWFNGKLKVTLHPATAEPLIVSREKAASFRKWLGD